MSPRVLLLFFLFLVAAASSSSSHRSHGRRSGLYYDNGNGQTQMAEIVGFRQHRQVQREILKLLGLAKRPRPSASQEAQMEGRMANPASGYLLDVYKEMQKEEEDDRHEKHSSRFAGEEVLLDKSNLVISLPARGQGEFGEDGNETWLWFDTSRIPSGCNLLKAQLRMHKTTAVNSTGEPISVQIQQMSPGWAAGDTDLELIETKSMTENHQGWVEFNMSQVVREWLVIPQTNWGIILSVKRAVGKEEVLNPVQVGFEEQPFLVCYFHSGQSKDEILQQTEPEPSVNNRHSKRDVSVNAPDNPYIQYATEGNDLLCQRRTLYVSFKDLDWQDWVIAPEGYAAYYCSGKCAFPVHAHLNASNHAIAQILVNFLFPKNATPVICTAQKLSAVSVLYYDDDSNVILKKYNNMVVKKCGCL